MTNSDLPTWMIYSGSLAGLLWAILQIISWINRLTHSPKLEIRLTKDIYFRLIEEGETIFSNVVFIARNGSIEVKDIKFNLIRKSKSQKKYTFSPRNIGNKIPNPPNPYAANNFWTKSCKAFIAKDTPTYFLFMSSLEEYSIKFKDTSHSYQFELLNYKNELNTKIEEIGNDGERYLKEINNKIEKIKSSTSSKLLSYVQLEPGDYELTAEVIYSRIGLKFLKKEKCVQSKITFSVDEKFKEHYEELLIRFLEISSKNILFNQNNPSAYPEYTPNKISEE
jgi:hypothetical protein